MKPKFGLFSCDFKYHLIEGFKSNKKICFFLFLFSFIGILTGVFTAINYCNGATLINFNDFSLCQYLSGNLGSLNLFFSRFLSFSVILIITTITSFSVYLIPINFFLLAYRGYLLSLNVAIMVIMYGIGGIITGLVIILPCHLLNLFLIGIFMCCAMRKAIHKKKFGVCKEKNWDKFIILLICLLIINIIETLLLALFSSKVILVI